MSASETVYNSMKESLMKKEKLNTMRQGGMHGLFSQAKLMRAAHARRAAAVIGVVLIVVTGLNIGPIGPVEAQAQSGVSALPLRFMEYQMGRLDDSTPQAVYVLDMVEGMVYSVSAFMRTGDVVPQVTVYDPGGQVVSLGVLPAGGTDSSVINAALAPVTGAYTVRLERVSGTGGDFVIIVQPGYEYLYAWDDFKSYDPRLSLCWEPVAGLESIWAVNNGEMVAYVLSSKATSANPPCSNLALGEDYYIQADVTIVNPPDYYEYGLEVARSANAAEYYAVLFSSQGDWAVMHYVDGGWTTVSDWQPSPVIHLPVQPVTVGVLVDGGTLSVYYDHQRIGQVEAYTSAPGSGVALLVSSGAGTLPTVEAHFDNVVITGPPPVVSG